MNTAVSPAVRRDDILAGILAVVVHGAFVLLMIAGISWQIHDPQPVMAELWPMLPEQAKPLPPEPQPDPEPVPRTTPPPEPKSEPRPAPKIEPEAKPADIQLEKRKQEETKLEEKRRQEELEKQKQAEKKKQLEIEKRRMEEARQMELEAEQEEARLEMERIKREQEKKLAEQKRREALRREEEDLERRMLEESLAIEANQVKARAAKAAADKRAAEIAKLVDLYKAKISDKVRGYARLPENLAGNPEAVFEVSVLPTGEISRIRLTKTSGNTLYDQAIEKAIEKSSPLPLPPDREAAAQFRLLSLSHKAKN